MQCKRTFSSARFFPCFGQKKRFLNPEIHRLYTSAVSQNRIALLLQINPKTVVRKFLFLGLQAKLKREAQLQKLAQSSEPLKEFEFDEMESFERSKCLPVSIPLVVLPGSRKILSFRVASMPANGLLAEVSRKKYGKRADERAQAADALFSELKGIFEPDVLIRTDQNPKYPGWLKPHFPKAQHQQIKGKRGSAIGQGELKKVVFDPLFSLNHTCAMIRANVNRLMRRTWCTTKKLEHLRAHLELYIQFHNKVLTAAAEGA
jgi:hypothetical protein